MFPFFRGGASAPTETLVRALELAWMDGARTGAVAGVLLGLVVGITLGAILGRR